LEAQGLVDELWGSEKDEWIKKSILTAFAMGDFSSDRSVQDYADGVSRRLGSVILFLTSRSGMLLPSVFRTNDWLASGVAPKYKK